MTSLFARLFLLCTLLSAVSCIKKPEPAAEEKPDNPPQTGIENLADLKLKSFKITTADNAAIYAPVNFTSADGIAWTGSIECYKPDLANLIATFEVDADRVLVGNTEQESGKSVNDFRNPVKYKLYTTKNEYREYTVTLTVSPVGYTGRPILAIITDDAKPITSRDDWVTGRVVIDPQEGDCDAFSGAFEIKGRGHNSWSADKKPYNFKLEQKTGLLGMNKHKRWTLLANASDKTLLRNRVAFEIGRRTGLAWTPDCRFIEVLLNGKFVGSYLLTEQIRVDANRVNITEPFEGATPDQVGYLLELDRYYDETNKFRTQRRDLPVNIKNPDEEDLTAAQKNYISTYLNQVEEKLYAGEVIDPTYKELLDVDSFIDWWIVIELTHNRDTKLPGSCYMYKDAGGKLCAGPLWDFDLTTFRDGTSFMQYDYEVDLTNETETSRSLWYKRLFSDPSFKARAKERWTELKPSFDTIGEFIEVEAKSIEAEATYNWSIWSLNAGGSSGDGLLSWSEATALMKTNYNKRLAWLDQKIQTW